MWLVVDLITTTHSRSVRAVFTCTARSVPTLNDYKVENRKKTVKSNKRICSEVSVNSPGNS